MKGSWFAKEKQETKKGLTGDKLSLGGNEAPGAGCKGSDLEFFFFPQFLINRCIFYWMAGYFIYSFSS